MYTLKSIESTNIRSIRMNWSLTRSTRSTHLGGRLGGGRRPGRVIDNDRHIVLVIVLMFLLHAVKYVFGPSTFPHRYCLITRVSSALLDLLVPQDHSTVRRDCRCWRQFDYDSFYEDLCQSEMVHDLSTSCSACELSDHYFTTLRSLLDVHAPFKTVCVRAARTVPWYDEDCRRE